jgi:hypothetical protein
MAHATAMAADPVPVLWLASVFYEWKMRCLCDMLTGASTHTFKQHAAVVVSDAQHGSRNLRLRYRDPVVHKPGAGLKRDGAWLLHTHDVGMLSATFRHTELLAIQPGMDN